MVLYNGKIEGPIANPRTNPTFGANKGYASKTIYFISKNYTLFSTTKCRVGANHKPIFIPLSISLERERE
jgi:hypothetical protein